jgi:hypothetical protein
MTGTNCDLFTHNQSRSYLNHLVITNKKTSVHHLKPGNSRYQPNSLAQKSINTPSKFSVIWCEYLSLNCKVSILSKIKQNIILTTVEDINMMRHRHLRSTIYFIIKLNVYLSKCWHKTEIKIFQCYLCISEIIKMLSHKVQIKFMRNMQFPLLSSTLDKRNSIKQHVK